MTPLSILDLIAGMIFIYFLMSMICNSIIEGIAAITRVRAEMLTKWIQENLPKLKTHFVNHTLLDGPNKGVSTTSYISASNFAFVLIDAITKEAGKLPATLNEIETAITELEKKAAESPLPLDLARVLKIFIAEARDKAKLVNQTKTELELFRLSIENWFDSMMERLGGTFKRWASGLTLLISSIAVIALNIDSIQIAKYLYSDENARNKLAMAAYSASEDSVMAAKAKSTTVVIDSIYKIPPNKIYGDTIIRIVTKSSKNIDSTVNKIASFIPIGWNLGAEQGMYKLIHHKTQKCECVSMFGFWWQKVFGLLITIFAVTLGAPFWFDVLSKVANLRNSIKPLKSEEKEKEKK